jgi:hypothetical protein
MSAFRIRGCISGRKIHVSLEAIAATESNEIFSGRQPRQDVKVLRRFGNTVPIFRVCWWFGSTEIDD